MNGARPKEHEDAGWRGEVDPRLYRNIYDNLASGVMSLNADGVITSFNEAARGQSPV